MTMVEYRPPQWYYFSEGGRLYLMSYQKFAGGQVYYGRQPSMSEFDYSLTWEILLRIRDRRIKCISWLQKLPDDIRPNPSIITDLKDLEGEMWGDYLTAFRNFMAGQYKELEFYETLKIHARTLNYVIAKAMEDPSSENIERLILFLFSDPEDLLEEMKFIMVSPLKKFRPFPWDIEKAPPSPDYSTPIAA